MYRIIVVTFNGAIHWQASYMSDSIPDTQAMACLPHVWHVDIWDTSQKQYVF